MEDITYRITLEGFIVYEEGRVALIEYASEIMALDTFWPAETAMNVIEATKYLESIGAIVDVLILDTGELARHQALVDDLTAYIEACNDAADEQDDGWECIAHTAESVRALIDQNLSVYDG